MPAGMGHPKPPWAYIYTLPYTNSTDLTGTYRMSTTRDIFLLCVNTTKCLYGKKKKIEQTLLKSRVFCVKLSKAVRDLEPKGKIAAYLSTAI